MRRMENNIMKLFCSLMLVNQGKRSRKRMEFVSNAVVDPITLKLEKIVPNV